MDMVTLALQRTNVRVLKRSSGRGFCLWRSRKERDASRGTQVCVCVETINTYIILYAALSRFPTLLTVGVCDQAAAASPDLPSYEERYR